jgi:hypothetical protein
MLITEKELPVGSIVQPLHTIGVDQPLLGGFEQIFGQDLWYYGAVDEHGTLQGVFETQAVLGMFFKGFESQAGRKELRVR